MVLNAIWKRDLQMISCKESFKPNYKQSIGTRSGGQISRARHSWIQFLVMSDEGLINCHFLAWHSTLIGYGMDWLSVGIMQLSEISGHGVDGLIFPVGQPDNATMSVHCHKSVPILI